MHVHVLDVLCIYMIAVLDLTLCHFGNRKAKFPAQALARRPRTGIGFGSGFPVSGKAQGRVLFKINDTVTNFIFLSDDQNNRIGVKSMKRKKFL